MNHQNSTQGAKHAGPKPKLRANAARYKHSVVAAVAQLIDELALPLTGKVFIEQAMLAPSRSTGAGRKNLSGRYPSIRMGVTMQFESSTLELPSLHELEHDDSVLAFCDQTPKIKLVYQGATRKQSYLVTPDFLVVYKDRVVLVECKPLCVLLERSQSDPALYQKVDGVWQCPPAQQAAAEMGFEHEIWTEDRFHPTKMANLRLLADYFEPIPETDPRFDEAFSEAVANVAATAQECGSVTIHALLDAGQQTFDIDHVYAAIAQRVVACDLAKVSLGRRDACLIHRDTATLEAFDRSSASIVRAGDWTGPTAIQFKAGAQLLWDGAKREIVHAGEKQIVLSGDDGAVVTLERSVVVQLVTREVIQLLEPADQASDERMRAMFEFINSSRPEDLATASERFDALLPILNGVAKPETRTQRRHLQFYRQAEVAFGNGFVGLVPKFSGCGNRQARLEQDALDIVAEVFNEKFLDKRNVNKKRCHEAIALQCAEKGLPTPSYSWFCQFVKKQIQYSVQRARQGDKAAYGISPRTSEDAGAPATPDPIRPFERGHIDHTQIDVEAIFSDTAEGLGRPWVTVMIDHYSRRILGFYLTYESPSYRSVLMTLRDCVRRHGRLPESIVVDGGKEFRSAWFEVTCAFFRVTVIRRPARQGRYGSQIERYFGSHNTMLLHNLAGNTQLRKNVRQMTPAVDPSRTAVWTLVDLFELLGSFYFEIYDTIIHTSILASPRDAFGKALQLHGNRPSRTLVYDQNFVMMTCPSTPKGTAKVQPDGVKINHFYYNAPGLSRHLGESVPVRYEPFDLSVAYVFVDRAWLRVRCRFGDLLEGLGEHQVALVTEEYKRLYGKARRDRLNDTTLAAFLREVEDKELLLADRKRALEQQRLLARINGTPATPLPSNGGTQASAAQEPQPGQETEPLPQEQEEAPIALTDMEAY